MPDYRPSKHPLLYAVEEYLDGPGFPLSQPDRLAGAFYIALGGPKYEELHPDTPSEQKQKSIEAIEDQAAAMAIVVSSYIAALRQSGVFTPVYDSTDGSWNWDEDVDTDPTTRFELPDSFPGF